MLSGEPIRNPAFQPPKGIKPAVFVDHPSGSQRPLALLLALRKGLQDQKESGVGSQAGWRPCLSAHPPNRGRRRGETGQFLISSCPHRLFPRWVLSYAGCVKASLAPFSPRVLPASSPCPLWHVPWAKLSTPEQVEAAVNSERERCVSCSLHRDPPSAP